MLQGAGSADRLELTLVFVVELPVGQVVDLAEPGVTLEGRPAELGVDLEGRPVVPGVAVERCPSNLAAENIRSPASLCGAASTILFKKGTAIVTPRTSSSPVLENRSSAAACSSALAWARQLVAPAMQAPFQGTKLSRPEQARRRARGLT